MKFSTISVIILASIGALPGTVLAQLDDLGLRAAAKHGWLANYEKAKSLARKTGKPLMVVFRCVP